MALQALLSLVFVLVGAVSIPMIQRRIPPNSIYGFRTPRTMSNPGVWYPANAFAGRAMLIAALVSLVATWLVPPARLLNVGVLLLVTIGPMLAAAAASFLYLRRL